MRDLLQAKWLQPAMIGGAALIALAWWLASKPDVQISRRVPGTDQLPSEVGTGQSNAVLRGALKRSGGIPGPVEGEWPQFRGAQRTGVSPETQRLLREWPGGKPRQLWSLEVGEGYAGPAVQSGRVFLMDYDREGQQDALRCLSLADGKEIWRFSYPVTVKRNHGMSRTTPAVGSGRVVALGPKCHVLCVDAESGELKWGLDLVRDFGATVPPWYAGQCPLVDGDRVILGVGGPEALLIAVHLETGELLWKTPNPDGWKMTHSSVLPTELAGVRQFIYCASGGVAGVAANDGALLWSTKEWKISIATVPSPVALPGDRLFLSGGYDAGSLLLEIGRDGDGWKAKTVKRFRPTTFGATQQTPILYGDHLYGIRVDGAVVCLDLDGNVVWASSREHLFGLGPLIIADGLIHAVDDSGRYAIIEATPTEFRLIASAQVLEGREAWGPLAIAGGRLLLRDLTRLVCLEVGAGASN
jgi:outer membrane protein assembly factor BamB